MSGQMSFLDTPNAISLPESAAGRLRFALRAGQTTAQCGRVVALVSLSARQAKAMGLLTSGTYGRPSSGSSASVALQESLVSKLRERLPTAGGMMWPQIWRGAVTPAQRRYCQLAVLASRTEGTDCGLWHTPRSVMIVETPENFRARMNSKRPGDRKDGLPNLAVQALWATPNTMDGMDCRSPEAMHRMMQEQRKGRSGPSNLREQVNPAMWPTPCSTATKGACHPPGKQGGMNLHTLVKFPGFIAQTENIGQLNPVFVCWLMGFSTDHLSSMLSAMQSYRKLPPNSSKRWRK